MGFVILAINLFFNTPIFFVSHPDKSRMTLLKIVALLVIGTLLECTPGCGLRAWWVPTRAPTPCLGEWKKWTPGGDPCCGGTLAACRSSVNYGEKKNINANTGDQGPMVIPGRNVWTPSTVFEPVWGQKDSTLST